MHKFRLFLLSIFFICFVPVTCLLHADENQEAAENIFRRAYTSISQIEEGKIFLKNDKLHFFEGKIYVEDIHGAGLAIPAVFSCPNGLYLKADGFNVFNCWKCKCGNWNHNWENPTHCRVCGRPRP